VDIHFSGGIYLERVGVDILTAVLVKSIIILDVTWYSPSEIYLRVEGTFCLLDSEDGDATFGRNFCQTTRCFTYQKILLLSGTLMQPHTTWNSLP
jgi:hypothetical protein